MSARSWKGFYDTITNGDARTSVREAITQIREKKSGAYKAFFGEIGGLAGKSLKIMPISGKVASIGALMMIGAATLRHVMNQAFAPRVPKYVTQVYNRIEGFDQESLGSDVRHMMSPFGSSTDRNNIPTGILDKKNDFADEARKASDLESRQTGRRLINRWEDRKKDLFRSDKVKLGMHKTIDDSKHPGKIAEKTHMKRKQRKMMADYALQNRDRYEDVGFETYLDKRNPIDPRKIVPEVKFIEAKMKYPIIDRIEGVSKKGIDKYIPNIEMEPKSNLTRLLRSQSERRSPHNVIMKHNSTIRRPKTMSQKTKNISFINYQNRINHTKFVGSSYTIT